MLLSLKVKVNSVFVGEFSQTETMCLQEVMLPPGSIAASPSSREILQGFFFTL